MRGVWMCVRQVDSLYDAGNVLFAATCDTLAPMASPSDIQLRKLVNEMESAFYMYAEIYGGRVHVRALTDSAEINRDLILSYGAAFNRILEDDEASEDSVELQDDVFNLTSRGCPKPDIIDMMFRCTTGRNMSVFDDLTELGLSGSVLLQLRVACAWCADRIALLNMPQVQGPLHFLPKTVPEISEEDRTRLITDLQKLPDLLHIFGDLLSMYPPENIRRFEKSGWGKEGQLAFFYLIIDHFKLGYPTLSRLLRTMRQVRYSVSPKTSYVHRFGRVRVKPKKRTSNVNDPLRDLALQRRLLRFFKANPSFKPFANSSIFWYLSDLSSHLRARGETFMTSFPYLLMFPPAPTESPDKKA